MKKILFFLLSATLFFACADHKKADAIKDIKENEKLLLADVTKMNPAVAADLIKKYDAFIKAFPKDTTAASFMFKAADVSRGIGEFGKAIKYWGDMREYFPDYRLTADAMFLQAFTYENDLGDKENAKRYYEKFLGKYPTHALANDAKKSIEVMDMPIEQLVKQFEEKNKVEMGK